MAGLIKRGNNYYAVYYVNGKERRKSLETVNLKLAQAKLRDIESGLDAGEENPFPTTTPIPDVLESYIGYSYSRRDTGSVDKDLSNLRTMFGIVCPSLSYSNELIAKKKLSALKKQRKKTGDVPPLEAKCFEAITPRQLTEWLTGYVNANDCKPKTGNRYREVLRKLFNYAVNVLCLRFPGRVNPAANIEPFRQGAPIIVYLTLEQIDEQLRVLREHHASAIGRQIDRAVKRREWLDFELSRVHHPRVIRRMEGERLEKLALLGDLERKLKTPSQILVMVALYIYAGIRREEGMWLKKGDVDLKTGFIRIQAKKAGDREWSPKNGKNRLIPISSKLLAFLEEYTPPSSDHGWYFPSPEGKWWDPDNFSHDLAKINHKYNLEWGCAEYRHTFGSQLAMKGVSLYKISEMMGNSPEICRKHYAALIPASLEGETDFPDVDFSADKQQVPKPQPPEPGERPRLRLVVNKQ